MNDLPKLPKGIERDDTEHGKIYYTRAQMMAYGQECLDKQPRKETPKFDQSFGMDFLSMLAKRQTENKTRT